MLGRFGKNAQGEVQAVVPGGQSELRLVGVFGRQLGELAFGDIGWIADDQVITFAAEGGKRSDAITRTCASTFW